MHRAIADPYVRKVLIKSLAFETTATEYQKAIKPLKAQGAPLEDWIKAIANIRSTEYSWTSGS